MITPEQKQELANALQQISAEYYKSVIEILSLMGDQDKVNYVRTPIHMPNGSKYILALLHTGGPVLSLKTLNEGGYGEFTGSVEQTLGLDDQEEV